MSKHINKQNRKESVCDEEICVVCFRAAEIFSIGECDHPVCHECSTRMRVLCARTECPICRKDMAMVVFTRKIHPFSGIQYKNMKCERRYSIYFEADDIMHTYDTLLQHACTICGEVQIFRNFGLLKEHMRKSHEKFYCDLCVDNIKIFTHERKCYSRAMLGQHRRIGDIDDKSHRGHPLCEFCDSRFMDNDELFRHLRRDHFFCHFCDADGLHNYYEDYDALRNHFKKEHFLCEEGTCLEERFTSAFRTKLDLQAHTMQNHGQSMSKQEARQARTVDIAFTVNHRQGQMADRGRGNRRGDVRDRERRQRQDVEEQASAAAATPPSQLMTKPQAIDINCVQDFPSLSGKVGLPGEGEFGGVSKSIAQKVAQQNRFTIRASRGLPLNEEEFPCLGSRTSVNVSSAPPSSATNPSSTHPPGASLHLSVNTKKPGNATQGGQNGPGGAPAGPNVSIAYNCSKPFSMPRPEPHFAARGKANPRIGAVSHSGNIILKNNSTGNRPRSAPVEDDFPSLQPSAKPFRGVSQDVAAPATSWVSNAGSAPRFIASKVPRKDVNSDTVASSKTANKNKTPVFESEEFPSLGPSSGPSLESQKVNYSGLSSLKIPIKKVLPDNDINTDNDESGSKGKKKKKGVNKPEQNNNDSPHDSSPTSKPATKKKQITLNNIFDDDPDAPFEDFSKGRLGEYESFVPVMSSNINVISSDRSAPKDTKKSELQIGTLKAPEFDADNFPSLNPSKGPKKTGKAKQTPVQNGSVNVNPSWNPAKNKTVPPGFLKKSQPGIPPGFTNTDMTFTSSLGHKFAISPTSENSFIGSKTVEDPVTQKPPPTQPSKEKKKDKPKTFILPPNFEQRNVSLIDAIQAACEGNPDKFNRFKQLAAVFRSGEMKGQEYFEKCRQVMGKKVLKGILPELLALLPDIDKQQAVLEAYQKLDGTQGPDSCFTVCSTCKQVLIHNDFPTHMLSHEFPTAEFPSLHKSDSLSQRRK